MTGSAIQCRYLITPKDVIGAELVQMSLCPFVPFPQNCISGVMVSVLASHVVDDGFKPPSGQTKDNKIDICCFSAKYAALRSKNKDWLALNQNSVSDWSNMSTRRLLFQ